MHEMLGPHKKMPQVALYNKVTLKCSNKMLSEERGKTQWENPPLKLNTEEVIDHLDEITPNSKWR